MTNARTVEFDLDRYLRNSKKVDLSGIEWDEEEVDALGLYLFADGPEGREHAIGIDETISAVPGLEGLTLIQDYLDAAERRVRERPGWAGVAPMPAARRDNGHPPVPTHWAESEDGRPDVMPATSDVERREEARAAHVMGNGGS